tara:strand:+ start:6258 stop:6440 length:183 start_codon:yes stop_codon:yes gene_type:complete
MSASKKEKTKSTPVEEKKETVKTVVQKNAQDEIIKDLDKKFEKLAELEERLKRVEERMGF